ncbi:MAG: coagulation factor 5/8 type domain-containing protein [Phycisphaerales bacterium]
MTFIQLPPLLLALTLCVLAACTTQPGDAIHTPARATAAAPDFGPTVIIADPATPNLQQRINEIFAAQEKAQFGDGRYAILFKPGNYNLDIPVGFYTQVAGLGGSPDDVHINGAVRSNPFLANRNATCNFWRCIENLSITPSATGGTNVWAVSQGAWLRRVHIKGNLALSDGGWSSGGYLADSRIDGHVDSGSQQQWFSRNADWGTWKGANWNMVFVGVIHPPAGAWPDKPYTVIDATPVIREKPYLCFEQGQYVVKVHATNVAPSRGLTWDAAKPATLPIDRFYIARADRDTAATLNAALETGKHLLLTPGIYHLDAALNVTRPDTIVLGLGYATLAPTGTSAALQVADVGGVTIAGILFEGSEAGTASLVTIGEPGAKASHASNPTVIADITCRTGGPRPGRAECMLTINSNNVIIDHAWLWRADHGEGAKWDVNTTRNGLIVNGSDVTSYGLFVEHQHEYQTIWNGNGGRVYFYQSEMPYDPPSAAAWSHGNTTGYASYKVSDAVTTHEAWGLGVYSYFRDAAIVADTAIEVPEVPGVKMHHMVTIRLNGLENSGIAHVINDRGEPVIHARKAVVD